MVIGIEPTKLAMALPGTPAKCGFSGECFEAAMDYCRKLLDGHDISDAYLTLIAKAYPADGRLVPYSRAPVGAQATGAAAVGPSWEGMLVTGLASFLATRAEAETVAWLLEQLKTRLCRSSFDLKDAGAHWLPETCALVTDADGFGSGLPGRIFVAALRRDIEHLPARIVHFAVQKAGEKSVPEFGAAVQFFFVISLEVRARPDVTEALKTVLARKEYREACSGWKEWQSWKPEKKVTCPLATAAALFVHMYPKIRELGDPPDQDDIDAIVTSLGTDPMLNATVTTLYGGEWPPWLEFIRLTSERPRVQSELKRLATSLEQVAGAVAVSTSTLPETASEATRRVASLAPLLLDTTEAVFDFFPDANLVNRKKVFELVRTVQHVADTLDSLLAAGRSIRQGGRPLEVIAGLSRDPTLRRQCVGQTERVPIGCGIATAAVFVEHIAAIATSAQGAISRDVAALAYKATLRMEHLKKGLCDLYKVDDTPELPPFLHKALSEDELANEDVLAPILRLLDTINLLQETLTGLEAMTGEKALLLAPALVRQVVEVIDAGTALVGPRTIPYREEILGVVDATELIVAGDYAGGIQLALVVFRQIVKAPGVELPAGVRLYLPLAIELASAKSADDVQAALEAAAAPAGGWKRKHVEFTPSISGFVGFTGGYEWPYADGIISEVPDGSAIGAFGAIGLDLSWGCPQKWTWIDTLTLPCPGGWSKGVFVSVLDLGQLTWSRVENTVVTDDGETTRAETTPEVDFAQVFSPGIYYHMSLGRSPFTIGVGSSFAPALRKYFFTRAGDPDEELLSTFRVNVFLAVDITILPF